MNAIDETQLTQVQPLIEAIDQADSPTKLVGAVRALAQARLNAGIPTLICVLGYNNPGAALAAVDGLVQLGDTAVQPLLEQMDDYNYGARAYTIRALAAIANPAALDVLLTAAETDFAPSVRRAAIKGLGCLRWHCFDVSAIPVAQQRSLQTLLLVLQDCDWAIRYAAVVGLHALVTPTDTPTTLTDSVLQRLTELAQTEPDAVVNARICMALQQLQVSS